jgi:hypothetical protein
MTSARGPLEDRLRSLGEVLDLDERVDTAELLARLDASPGPASRGRRVLQVVAAAVVVFAVVVAAVPSSRRAVADWLGFDGARIEQRPDVTPPAEADPVEGRGVGTVVDVGDERVLVTEFTGTLENPGLEKVLSPGSGVVRAEVGGRPAIWIDGDPHEVSFLDGDGRIVFEGFAGNTLLWQDGPVIRRVEGFDDLDAAIRYAETVGAGRD